MDSSSSSSSSYVASNVSTASSETSPESSIHGEDGAAAAVPTPGSSGGTTNLPPILFHHVHGENIHVSRDGKIACRMRGYGDALTFSSRPINVDENQGRLEQPGCAEPSPVPCSCLGGVRSGEGASKSADREDEEQTAVTTGKPPRHRDGSKELVCFKLLDVSSNWKKCIRIGFTSNDPDNLRCLPKYGCSHWRRKRGYWTRELPKRYAVRYRVMFFYVTHGGDVNFGVNGEEKGVFFNGVETRGPLWAIIDVYGYTSAIELVNPRRALAGSASSSSVSADVDSLVVPPINLLPAPSTEQPQPPPSTRQLQQPIAVDSDALSPQQLQRPSADLSPLLFHRMTGRHIRLSSDSSIATRIDGKLWQGYVFTSRPVQPGEKMVIRVLETEPRYVGALSFGITSCNPSSLRSCKLPYDSHELLDRPEYWVVCKDAGRMPQRGDELSFTITHTGEVQFSKNGSTGEVLMHVDHTQQLWAFFDVYGSTKRVQLSGSVPELAPLPPLQPLPSLPPLQPLQPDVAVVHPPFSAALFASTSVTTVAHATTAAITSVTTATTAAITSVTTATTAAITSVTTATTAAITSVITATTAAITSVTTATTVATASVTTGATVATTSVTTAGPSTTFAEPMSEASFSNVDSAAFMAIGDKRNATTDERNECAICCEGAIDSVLYTCGHIFMCYLCAVQQWRGKGDGHCPICRAVISDVIRIYKC